VISAVEVIAPNPQPPPPGRGRRFGLDRLAADAPPRLATWVVRTTTSTTPRRERRFPSSPSKG
jgi:hypothetical protein